MYKMSKNWNSICFILFLSIFSIISLPTSFATSNILYNENYFTGDTFDIEGSTFDVTVLSSGNVVLIGGSWQGQTIDMGSCLSSQSLEICLEDSGYDTSNNEYYVRLKVSEILPEINFEQEISSSNLHPGDTLHLNVTIENTGSSAANEFEFVQEIPRNMRLDDNYGVTEGMSLSSDYLSWSTSSFDVDDEITLTYSLIIESDSVQELQQFVEYFDGFSTQREFSPIVSLNILSPFNFEITKNATGDLYLGDLIKFTIEIDNDSDDVAIVDELEVIVPNALSIVEIDDRFQSNDNKLHLTNFEIDSESSESFDFVTRVVEYSPSEVVASSNLLRLSTSEYFEDFIEFDVELRETSYELRLWSDSDDGRTYEILGENTDFEGALSHRIDVYVQNPYLETIYDINLNIESDYLNYTASRDSISGRTLRRVFQDNIQFPNVNSSTDDDINITISYRTSFDYYHIDSFEISFTYLPLDQIEVEHSLSENNPESGSLVTVRVEAENPRLSTIEDVNFQEIIPDNLFRSGNRFREISFDGGEDRLVYEYNLRLPIVSRETDITLNTQVSYSDNLGTHFYEVPFTFTVYPRTPDISLSSNINREEIHLGRINALSFTVENNEDYRFENVFLRLNGGRGIYFIDSIKERIGNINPGRTVSSSDIDFVVFDDDANSFDYWVEFIDDQGVKHNTKSSIPNLNINEDSILDDSNFPRLSIDLIDLELIDEDTFNYTIKIENFGYSNVDINLIDNNYEDEILMKFNDTIYLRRSAYFEDFIGLLHYPASYLSFDYGGITYFAISEDLDISDIYEESVLIGKEKLEEDIDDLNDVSDDIFDDLPDEETDVDIDLNESDTFTPDIEDYDDDEEENEMGLIASFFDWLLRLIGLRG